MSVYEKFIAAAAQDAPRSVLTTEHEAILDRLFEEYSQYRVTPTTFSCATAIVFFDIPEDRVFRDLAIPSVPTEDLRSMAVWYWKKKMRADNCSTNRVFVSNVMAGAISVVVCPDPNYIYPREHLSSRDLRTYALRA